MFAITWPTPSDEIAAVRDAEERRLLPIIKAAGVVPT
jgi:hypothetical protein